MIIFDYEMFWFCVVAGIVSTDTEAAWQTLLSQPLPACILAGLIFGELGLAVTVGILLQLPYLVEVPVGGCHVALSGLGAVNGAGIVFRLNPMFPDKPNLVLAAGLVVGIIAAWGLAHCWRIIRRLNLVLVQQAQTAINRNQFGMITVLQSVGVANSFLFGVICTLLVSLAGLTVLTPLIEASSVDAEAALILLRPALLGAGLAVLVKIFAQRKNVFWTLAGAGLAGILLWVRTVA